MYILTKENGSVIIDQDASQAVARIVGGMRGWALNLDEAGVPTIGGEVKIGNPNPIATVSKYELLSAQGEVLGEGQVKEQLT